MHLDRCIAINICITAIYQIIHWINGILSCAFNKILWLINYLSIIKVIFDIVLRAVNVYLENLPIPQLEQINITIKHTIISLFGSVSKISCVTIAVISQNANSFVYFLLCKKLEGEVAYAK